MLTRNELELVKYFISSNSAIQELKNESLNYLFERAGLHVPDEKTFKSTVLQKAIDKVEEVINQKLLNSTDTAVIFDNWATKQQQDFTGVAVMTCDEKLERDCFVIGLEKMDPSHTAENIKASLESVLNKYTNDKRTIIGWLNNFFKELYRGCIAFLHSKIIFYIKFRIKRNDVR